MLNSLKILFSRKTIILVVAALFFTTVNVFGSVVQMISGKVVNGEIVERNDESIKIDTGLGIPVTYYLDEIRTINGKPVALVEEKQVKEVEAPKVAGTPKAVEILKKTEKTDAVVTAEPAKAITSAKDIATLEGIDLFKEQVSPVAVKPKEVSRRNTAVDTNKRTGQRLIAETDKNLGLSGPDTVKAEPEEDFAKVLIQKVNKYIQSQIMEFKETRTYVRKKLPFNKERIHAIPVKVRWDALVFVTSFMAILYVFVCFPLMQIAKKLGRKHSWLIWIPFVQIVYFIYMAKEPLWLAVFFFIPVLNVFLSLFLFIDIVKLLKKPRWLIVFIIIPGVNVFTLWYLAISKADQP